MPVASVSRVVAAKRDTNLSLTITCVFVLYVYCYVTKATTNKTIITKK